MVAETQPAQEHEQAATIDDLLAAMTQTQCDDDDDDDEEKDASKCGDNDDDEAVSLPAFVEEAMRV